MVKNNKAKNGGYLPIVSVFLVVIARYDPDIGILRLKKPEPEADLSHCCATSLEFKAFSTA